jgi:hypothetical protein
MGVSHFLVSQVIDKRLLGFIYTLGHEIVLFLSRISDCSPNLPPTLLLTIHLHRRGSFPQYLDVSEVS